MCGTGDRGIKDMRLLTPGSRDVFGMSLMAGRMRPQLLGLLLLFVGLSVCVTDALHHRLSPRLLEIQESRGRQPDAVKAAAAMDKAVKARVADQQLNNAMTQRLQREIIKAGGLRQLDKAAKIATKENKRALKKQSEAEAEKRSEKTRKLEKGIQKTVDAAKREQNTVDTQRVHEMHDGGPDTGVSSRCDESGCDTEVDLRTNVQIYQKDHQPKGSNDALSKVELPTDEPGGSASQLMGQGSLESVLDSNGKPLSASAAKEALKQEAKVLGKKKGPMGNAEADKVASKEVLTSSEEGQPSKSASPPKLPGGAESGVKKRQAEDKKKGIDLQKKSGERKGGRKGSSGTNKKLGLTASGMIKSVPPVKASVADSQQKLSVSSEAASGGNELQQDKSEVPKKGTPPPPVPAAGGTSGQKKGKKQAKNKKGKKGGGKWNPLANSYGKGTGLGIAVKSRSDSGTHNPTYKKPHAKGNPLMKGF